MTKKRIAALVIALVLAFISLAATGNIRWAQIYSGDRHGTDTKGQSSDGTGTSGSLAKFNSGGGLTNGPALPLSVGNGGTGQTSFTDGQLLIGNSTGNTLTKATLTAGTGITVTNGGGSITIASSGGGGGFGPIGSPVAPPSIASFTWVNQGGSTATNPSGSSSIVMTAPANSGNSARMLVVSAPSTPYIVDAFLVFNLSGYNYQNGGLCFRNSSSGKFMTFYMINSASGGGLMGYLGIDYWSSSTVPVSTSLRIPYVSAMLQSFLRIADDGTNRTYSISSDGVTYKQFYSEARTTQFTADQVGLFLNEASNSAPSIMTLESWNVH